MKELTNTELKEELKNILVEVDLFLRKHRLRYTVYAGTLLGCVRHKGFIPWDDDIDIAMLRNDYEELISLLKASGGHIRSNIYAIGYEMGESNWPYIKIVNKDILANERGVEESKYLWIDVFPLDGISSHPRFYYYYKNIIYRIFMDKRRQLKGEAPSLPGGAIKNAKEILIWSFARILSINSIVDKYIRTCKKYSSKDNGLVCNNVWGPGYSNAFPREFMNNLVEMQFEDISVCAIADADTLLKIAYGDYMQLPPIEKRVNHGIKAWRVGCEENKNA